MCYFNSRPSARGDTTTLSVTASCLPFQFTPLREGRPSSNLYKVKAGTFQFTPLREGRHHSLLFLPLPSPFQFTPLREGRRINRVVRAADVNFNSRPSARGDKIVETDCMLPIISIHAPPRGATPAQKSITPVGDYFNSRPSARGDHAVSSCLTILQNFNSRPSARGDARPLR